MFNKITKEDIIRFCTVLVVSILVNGIFFGCYHLYKEYTSIKEKEPIVLDEKEVEDINTVQDKLNVNKQNAQEIVTQIKEIHTEQKQPIITYIETSAKTTEEAAQITQEKIISKDDSIPDEAKEDTDKTIVSPNGTRVDVYKINTYRNWEAGIGVGKYDNETYIPVSLQRNYDRCHSVEIQANFDTEGHYKGSQVMWKVHF